MAGCLAATSYAAEEDVSRDTTAPSARRAGAMGDGARPVPDVGRIVDGSGSSYWGPIPSRVDSTVAEAKMSRTPRPTWEYPLLVPHYILKAPLWLIFSGLGAGYRSLDESGTLQWLGRLLAPKNVPYGATAALDLGSLAGLGFGISVFHHEFLGPANRVQFKGKISSDGSHRIAFGSFWNQGGRTGLEVGTGYRCKRTARYFGLGPRSSQTNQSFFTQETSWGGLTLHQKLGGHVHLELMGLVSGVGARLPGGRAPSLPDVFPPQEQPRGYGVLSTATTGSLSLIRNTTRTTGRPRFSNIQRLKASYTHDVDDPMARFWTYRAEIEAFIPAWYTDRAFAVRGYVSWIDAASEDLPFQRLLTNDDPDAFRGYKDNRFRDRGITALSVEYRWAVWANRQPGEAGLDGYIATDLGQVFNRYAEINRRNVTVSYVVGLRGVRASGFAWRAEIGWSKDEVRLRLTSDQIFQAIGENLYRGREEVALR
jgi:hypothetical protein